MSKRVRVRWEDPPPLRQAHGRLSRKIRVPVLEAVRNSPGRWALVGSYASEITARSSWSHFRKRKPDIADGFAWAIRGNRLYVKYDPKEAKEKNR